jgi:hypothetical protein
MPNGLTGGYPTNVFSLPAPVSFRGVQSDFRNPLVEKWNFVVQRELPSSMALEVGYEGNHQAHQVVLWDSDPARNIGTTNTSINTETQRIILAPCPAPCASIGNGESMTSSFGYGNYNALSTKLEKRFSHGLQFLTQYVWSHALANSSTPLSGSTNFGPKDATNYATGYSSAAWDIRHNFTTGFNYDIPVGRNRTFGSGMNKVLDAAVGNWHVNALLSLRTGQPYTLSASCQGVWNRCVPDVVGSDPNSAPATGRGPGQWFNIANFVAPASLTGGDLGLQSQTGPPTRTADFSIFKDFPITERWKLQFRAEGFNIANTPQFSLPDASLNDSKALGGNGNFGKIFSTQAASERHIQFMLRLNF